MFCDGFKIQQVTMLELKIGVKHASKENELFLMLIIPYM